MLNQSCYVRASRRHFNRSAPHPWGLDPLEPRMLLAATPVVAETVREPDPNLNGGGFADSRGSARGLNLSPMLQTRVSGALSNGLDVDMLRVDLTRGQFLNVTLSGSAIKLTLYNTEAKRVDAANGGKLLYRVPASARYYVRLSSTDPRATTPKAYELGLQPIGLSVGESKPELLQAPGHGLYAIRDGRSLHITGPVGHGFTLLSDWRQTRNRTAEGTASTFEASESVTLKSVVGDLTVPIPKGAYVRVSAAAGANGTVYGQISGIELGMRLGPMDFAGPFGRSWGSVFQAHNTSVNNGAGGWGLALGDDPLLAATGLPLSPNVPYLFYTDSKGFNADFAGVKVAAKGSFGYTVVVDPSDSFFVAAAGVPVLGDVAFGISGAGVIPFRPDTIPTALGSDGRFFGNVYLKAGLDVSAIAAGSPLLLEGDIVVDLDANNDGRNLGGYKPNISAFLRSGLGKAGETAARDLSRVFGDIQLGVNGRASVGYEKGEWQLSVPVGEGTFVYSAVKQGLFARGRTVNPFANTSLRSLVSRSSIDIDAHVLRDGSFRVAATGRYQPGGFTVNASVIVDQSGARVSGTAGALGTRVALNGSIKPDGRFTLTGRGGVSLGPLNGKANFTLHHTNRAVTFGAALDARLSTTLLGIQVGGKVSADLSFGLNSRGMIYSGRGGASLFAGPAAAGTVVVVRPNSLGFEVDLGALGKPSVSIPLPA